MVTDDICHIQIHASTVNHDKDNVIRLGTDLRFVDKSGNWDTVSDGRQARPFLHGENLADSLRRTEVDRGFPIWRRVVNDGDLNIRIHTCWMQKTVTFPSWM